MILNSGVFFFLICHTIGSFIIRIAFEKYLRYIAVEKHGYRTMFYGTMGLVTIQDIKFSFDSQGDFGA